MWALPSIIVMMYKHDSAHRNKAYTLSQCLLLSYPVATYCEPSRVLFLSKRCGVCVNIITHFN